MASGVYTWSQTAATNASADSSVNWSEGQAPSSVNDSARALMASAAKWRDDITGAIATGGTSTAYTVTSYSAFDSLAHMNGQMIAFTPHTTCGSTVTLSVDGLGAKPLRSAPSTEIVAGHLVQGTPYVAVYNSSDSAFYLQGFFGNPYSAPIGGMLDFIGTSVPNSSFVFPYGQAISRTTYVALFSFVGTTYGTGDGSTTFNVPDLRGRVVAGKDDMGGSIAGRLTSTYFGGFATNLGTVGGGESTTLTLAQLPTGITSSGIVSISVTTTESDIWTGATDSRNPSSGNTFGITTFSGSIKAVTSTGNNNIGVTSTNTSGNAHRTVQPTIVLNKILRII